MSSDVRFYSKCTKRNFAERLRKPTWTAEAGYAEHGSKSSIEGTYTFCLITQARVHKISAARLAQYLGLFLTRSLCLVAFIFEDMWNVRAKCIG